MKPIVLAICLMALVGCIHRDPLGVGYLIVDNQTNEQISVSYKLVYYDADTVTVCVLPQTKDTIYSEVGIGGCFTLGQIKVFEIATCDNPTHVLYKQEPINELEWIVEEQSTKDGFYSYSSNTFVVTDTLLNH